MGKVYVPSASTTVAGSDWLTAPSCMICLVWNAEMHCWALRVHMHKRSTAMQNSMPPAMLGDPGLNSASASNLC